MKIIQFKIVKIDNGFCQITYASKNKLGQTIYHCLQDNGKNHGGVRLLRATRYPDFEPEYEVKFQNCFSFEMPTGDSEIERKVRKYIEDMQDFYQQIN